MCVCVGGGGGGGGGGGDGVCVGRSGMCEAVWGVGMYEGVWGVCEGCGVCMHVFARTQSMWHVCMTVHVYILFMQTCTVLELNLM